MKSCAVTDCDRTAITRGWCYIGRYCRKCDQQSKQKQKRKAAA